MASDRSPLVETFAGWGIYVVGFIPAVWSFWLGATGGLGADPVRAFEQTLGLWALRFLVLTLAVTPLRQLAGINLLRFRRALGLLAFWYAAMHFSVYLTLDRGLIWSTIIPDIARRPFITLGFAALMFLLPLALTSNRLSIRRLGKNWRRLHRLVYVAASLAAVHYLLATKVLDPTQAAHIGLVLLLLGYRLVRALLVRRPERRAA
ncbi:protein-methionine-sulfoxide reductase heme-binding subunit MsrQ [Pleomorphomonas sp. JP5]|uniref:protein-methionine-sulfoxide reductase heme-binding subunit MsrQ n=1 Tax=Pleomorphomonas sp. JP5 TaxID=2942998 RepID=UPI002044A837|nr:protein-methionine-sulfoxide reductase heme-binding subunit MsrQ [Pleomorphomonas sp. JP5]